MMDILTVLFALWIVGGVLVGGFGLIGVYNRGGFAAVSEDYRAITGSQSSTAKYAVLFSLGVVLWPWVVYSIYRFNKALNG